MLALNEIGSAESSNVNVQSYTKGQWENMFGWTEPLQLEANFSDDFCVLAALMTVRWLAWFPF